MSVDRNSDYMRQMWDTTRLVTDYYQESENKTRVLQEIMHDYASKHDFKKQEELHEKIRNDEDYDDWFYGTEPSYGSSWK